MKKTLLLLFLLTIVCRVSAQQLVIPPVTCTPGATVDVPIELINSEAYTGYEMHIFLPEGFELTSFTSSSRYNGTFMELRQNETNGSYGILSMLLQTGVVITGNSGTLLTLHVKVPSTASDDYTCYIREILFSDENNAPRYHDDISFTITVSKPETITITAKSYSREYGEENPKFDFDVSGGSITGTPTLTCSATKYSDVGTYTIIVENGTVQGDVKLVDGTLTVTKAPLTVRANDCERYVGEENPAFTLSYSGWKNGQSESVLTTKPTATCTATKDSPAGTYPITVSGGSAKNYEFNYVSGTLTVKEKTSQKELKLVVQPSGGEVKKGTKVRIDVTTTDDEPVEGARIRVLIDSPTKYVSYDGESAPFDVTIDYDCSMIVSAFKDGFTSARFSTNYIVVSSDDSINNTCVDGKEGNSSVYSLSGQRLSAPRKGVNIVGGRKVVVK